MRTWGCCLSGWRGLWGPCSNSRRGKLWGGMKAKRGRGARPSEAVSLGIQLAFPPRVQPGLPWKDERGGGGEPRLGNKSDALVLAALARCRGPQGPSLPANARLAELATQSVGGAHRRGWGEVEAAPFPVPGPGFVSRIGCVASFLLPRRPPLPGFARFSSSLQS